MVRRIGRAMNRSGVVDGWDFTETSGGRMEMGRGRK